MADARLCVYNASVRGRAPSMLVLGPLLGVGACSCQSSDDDAKSAPAVAPDAATKIGVQCRPAEELDDAGRQALNEATQAIFGSLRAGQTQPLWASLHPQARRPESREAFEASVQAASERLAGAADPPTREFAFVVDVQGGINDLARVTCGPADDPTLVWTANVGAEDLAVVSLLSAHDPFSYATTLQLRKRGDTWRLLGMQTAPARYRDKSAADYEQLAAKYAEDRQLVAAFLMLGIAQTLAERAGAVKTEQALRLDDAVARIGRTDGFVNATTKWDVAGDEFDILGLSLLATRSDLSIVVKYVNDRGLVEELLGRDADKLMDHVRTNFPELRERFDGVVFEAYPQRPDDSGGTVQAYRTVRLFDPPTPPAAAAPSAPAAPASPPPSLR